MCSTEKQEINTTLDQKKFSVLFSESAILVLKLVRRRWPSRIGVTTASRIGDFISCYFNSIITITLQCRIHIYVI